jgi:hypothetical protein
MLTSQAIENVKATVRELKAELTDVESRASRIRLTISVLSELLNEKAGKEVNENEK